MSGGPFQAPPAGGGTPLAKLRALIYQNTPTTRTQDLISYDYRQVQGVVPVGVTATPHGLKVPNAKSMARLEAWTVTAPAPGESTVIRMFRVRGTGGFSFALLNTPFTLDASTFPGAGIPIDLTSLLLPGVNFVKGDFLACSWEHAGAQTMQPLNVNWNTSNRPVSGAPPVPLLMAWPPS
jgi:hypothetical protein